MKSAWYQAIDCPQGEEGYQLMLEHESSHAVVCRTIGVAVNKIVVYGPRDSWQRAEVHAGFATRSQRAKLGLAPLLVGLRPSKEDLDDLTEEELCAAELWLLKKAALVAEIERFAAFLLDKIPDGDAQVDRPFDLYKIGQGGKP